MIFNSFEYFLFLPMVFLVYWLVFRKSRVYQNLFLLFMSYVFYGLWNWHFLFLLVFSTVLDFYSGLKIEASNSKKQRKFWLILAVTINLGFLSFFKYFNFFAESFNDIFKLGGSSFSYIPLDIILPVGISFYTFHGLSYVFDIYNEKTRARKNFIDYGLFVSFFPLLVAGPIERATHLLPQIESKRKFEKSRAVDGLKQILWGLFKKIVIADNCAIFVNLIFEDSAAYSGSTLAVGAILFAFQIYGDFSGYSDIALGSARLLGFELLKNFSYPYFSRNMAEFWKRWHISLSTWFRDYLYIPLGGNRTIQLKQIVNVLIVFLVSGFWHGANWTFILWGFVNAFFVIIDNFVFKTQYSGIVASGRVLPNLKEFLQIGVNFMLISLIWVFFRSESIAAAFSYLKGMLSSSFFSVPQIRPRLVLILIIVFVVVEWLGREDNYALEKVFKIKAFPLRWVVYSCIILTLFIFGASPQTFIYFQF